jgi:hypothetical protein
MQKPQHGKSRGEKGYAEALVLRQKGQSHKEQRRGSVKVGCVRDCQVLWVSEAAPGFSQV